MGFLKNAWYCAGWSTELGEQLLARTFLNEPVVMYRDSKGQPVALGDRCPHRFAPLSKGKKEDDCLRCPYHGLKFDPSGACVHSPYSDTIPIAAKVKSYPLLERHGALWIWMGDAAHADASTLPDFTDTTLREGWNVVHGQLVVHAHYELVADNLLDLTHVPFLHPFLGGGGPPPPGFAPLFGMEQNGNTVVATNLFKFMPLTPFYRMLWPESAEPPPFGEMRAHMRWDPPSNLLLDTGMNLIDHPQSTGPSAPSAHLLTPETDTTTHYFWAMARNTRLSNPELDREVYAGTDATFRNEDEVMIMAVSQRMGTTDLMALKPVLLSTDAPAVRARRILQELIAAEAK